MIGAGILRSHDQGGKTVLALAETVGLIAGDEDIAVARLGFTGLALGNGQWFQKRVVTEEHTGVFSTKRMNADRRNGKAERFQTLARRIEVHRRQNQMINRSGRARSCYGDGKRVCLNADCNSSHTPYCFKRAGSGPWPPG